MQKGHLKIIKMRQTEIFPILIDQEKINDYLWFQETLDDFKNKKKIFLRSRASFKNTLKVFINWSNSSDYKYSKSALLEQIQNVENALKNNKETLISIDSSIAECEDMIIKYSIFLESKNISMTQM